MPFFWRANSFHSRLSPKEHFYQNSYSVLTQATSLASSIDKLSIQNNKRSLHRPLHIGNIPSFIDDPPPSSTYDASQVVISEKHEALKMKVWAFIRANFIPSGQLSSDYYTYTLWRMAQRLVSATSNVFGTQALLLALGFKSKSIGISAATTWVLKDALGKVSRIIWASTNGRKFDSDAKKWRYRSSILFFLGNALEIVTYIFPSMFLILAAVANALKQMSMVTFSATRNTIYKSFSRHTDNIGDITAKGEAQIAVIDLMGMLIGIVISKAIGSSRSKIATAFLLLSALDLICIYNEIKSVVFYQLNFERVELALNQIFDEKNIQKINSPTASSLSISPIEISKREKLFLLTRFGDRLFCDRKSSFINSNKNISNSLGNNSSEFVFSACDEISPRKGFIVSLHVQPIVDFVSEVKIQCELFRTGKVVSVGKDGMVLVTPQIILHKHATDADIFRALIVVHRCFHELSKIHEAGSSTSMTNNDRHFVADAIEKAFDYEKKNYENISKTLVNAGWDMSKFMFGRITAREVW